MSRRARHKHSIGVIKEPFVYNCSLCNYKTKSETGIKLHTKKSHNVESDPIDKKDVINQCDACRKTFENLEEIMKHVKLCYRQT